MSNRAEPSALCVPTYQATSMAGFHDIRFPDNVVE